MGRPELAAIIGAAAVDKKMTGMILDDPKQYAKDNNIHELSEKEVKFLKSNDTRDKIAKFAQDLNIEYDPDSGGKGSR
jgi:hypothetical protein